MILLVVHMLRKPDNILEGLQYQQKHKDAGSDYYKDSD